MPRRPRSSFHSVLVGAALLAAVPVAACSLLAPSDEEAMAGLGSKADGAIPGEADTGVAADGAVDAAKKEGGSSVCPQCPAACNNGQCSACFLTGGVCASNAECCGGVCNAQGRCGAMAGACTADNEDCTTTPDSCCPGETCSAERGSRCATCRSSGGNCKADTDCCTVRCNGGTCSACIPSGTAGCTRPRECCSGVCTAGTCG